ncbi:MAG: tetratricopeptide repeat protein [Planctomycetota bacterium]
MKIGPINLSYRLPFYIGANVAAVIVLFMFWRQNADTRMESIYRERILRGAFDDNPDALAIAINACRSLPQKVRVRLYLAGLLFRDKENKAALKEAHDIWKGIAADSAATMDEKAWALVGAGVANFTAAESSARPAAAAEAAKLFQQALSHRNNCADALINLALAQLWKGDPGALEEAEKRCQEALAAPPASLFAQAQLYNLHGWLLAQRNNSKDAITAFARAQALRPDREDLIITRRIAQLATLTQKNISPEARCEMLKKTENELKSYGDQELTALLAIGCGWMMLKDAPDYLTGPFLAASRNFDLAIQRKPDDPRAYRYRAALFEERIAALTKTLTVQVAEINSAVTGVNLWTGKETAVEPVGQDLVTLNAIQIALRELDAIWMCYADCMTDPQQKFDGKLRRLACSWRSFWNTPKKDFATRLKLQQQAIELSHELIKLNENNGDGYFALGQALMEKGDFAAALKTFETAKNKDCKAPTLSALLKGLQSCKAEIVDFRPSQTQRWFGETPLIVARLKSIVCPSGYRDVKMLLDDKPLTSPVVIGTQIFYQPENTTMLDGSHTIKVSVTDAFGTNLDFPPINFTIDKKPPTLKIIPDTATVLTSKAQWTLTLSDESGINLSKTKVILKTASSTISPFSRDIVKDGKYKISIPDFTPPIQIGAIVGETFKISAGQDLAPGEYTLDITAQDMEGIVLNTTRTYTVKW